MSEVTEQQVQAAAKAMAIRSLMMRGYVSEKEAPDALVTAEALADWSEDTGWPELARIALATARAEAEALREEVERYAQALVNHNDVLRSAYQIAARKGAQTEWEGFTLRAGSVLHFHHEEVEAARTALERPGA